MLLWCASWHQVPAASLPDDDIVLARLLFTEDLDGMRFNTAISAMMVFINEASALRDCCTARQSMIRVKLQA